MAPGFCHAPVPGLPVCRVMAADLMPWSAQYLEARAEPRASIWHDLLFPTRSGGRGTIRVREDTRGSLANPGWPIAMDPVDPWMGVLGVRPPTTEKVPLMEAIAD